MQEIRTSVFSLGINECYSTKMTSRAQQVEDMEGRNMNYLS